MSDPMLSTNETRPHTCSACPRIDIVQRKLIGAFAGGEHWSTESHEAPCGLPCWGGAVPGKAYRAGEYHRDQLECPRCGPSEAVRARVRELRERASACEHAAQMALDVLTTGKHGSSPNSLNRDEVIAALRELLGAAP